MSDIEYAKTSVKVINDFLIDIIGSVVPGIIFLFCVIASVGIPAVMLYFGYPVVQETDPEYATKIELLISNNFQGWFWLVIFFTFIILAYAIGNIFYRRDIKDMDKDSFKYVRTKHFIESVIPSLVFSDIRFKNWKVRRKFCSLKKQKKQLGEDSKRHFIKQYADLLYDYIDQNEKKAFRDETLSLLNGGCSAGSRTLDKIIEKLNHKAYCIYLGDTRDLAVTDAPEPCETTEKQYDVNSDFLREYVSAKYYEKLSLLLKEGNTSDPELTFFNAAGWFFRFSLRSEFACDTEDYCQFPYLYYDKYLCRREAFHLMKHVKWNTENARSKNALNKLKMRIQLASKDEYSILVKNEAHIRMASSSRVVAYWTRTIAYYSLAVLLIVALLTYIGYRKYPESPFFHNLTLDFAVLLRMGSIMLIPVCIILLSNYIWQSVKKFLHYQRLREIFFVLQAYNEIFYTNIRGLPEDLIYRIHKEDRQSYKESAGR
ncbi:MAG: hypothetical protein LUE26_08020 [Alistipes sp.]|nr:hypothetical protein [Alistipes sp.]